MKVKSNAALQRAVRRARESVPEEEIQKDIIEALSLRHIVLQTTHRVKLCQCPHCGEKFRPRGAYGSSPGVPDLLCTKPDFPRANWLGIEVKGPTTPLSPAQAQLEQQGRIIIARSIREALEAAREFQRNLP